MPFARWFLAWLTLGRPSGRSISPKRTGIGSNPTRNGGSAPLMRRPGSVGWSLSGGARSDSSTARGSRAPSYRSSARKALGSG